MKRLRTTITGLLVMLLMILNVVFLSSVTYAEQWAKKYGVSRIDAVQQTEDGGYIAAAWNEGDDVKAFVMKLDLSGNVQWTKKTGDSNCPAFANSVHQTSDNGYMVAGSKCGAWVSKLDSNGNVQWQRTFRSEPWFESEGVISMQKTSDGGCIVLAQFYPYSDASVLKLDSDGNVQWQKRYDTGYVEHSLSIYQTLDGGYIILGHMSYPPDVNIGSSWVMKLDAEGNTLWSKVYKFSGSHSDSINGIHPTSDNGYIMAGYYMNVNFDMDVWVIKTNAEGDVQWERTYGGAGTDIGISLEQTSDSGYVIAAQTASFSPGTGDAWVLKINAEGDVQWERTYGSFLNDSIDSIHQTSDGEYIMGGFNFSFGRLAPVGHAGWLLKVGSNGDLPDCSIMGSSQATVNTSTQSVTTTVNVTVATTNVVPEISTAPLEDATISEGDICGAVPFIVDFRPKGWFEPGKFIRIYGVGFGNTQGDSVIHIGPSIFNSSNRRIKLWSDTMIKMRLPNYQCGWFNGQDYRNRRGWVTVDGVDSNKRKIVINRPSICP